MVYTQINVALRLICGAVQSTELEWLSVLSNIAPAFILREKSALRECEKIRMNEELPIHNDIATAPITLRLKSRKPFWCFYRESTNMDNWKDRWRHWWEYAEVHNKSLIEDATIAVNGIDLPRRTWVRVNRIRTGQGCVAFLLHRWEIIDSPLCHCGMEQTMEHFATIDSTKALDDYQTFTPIPTTTTTTTCGPQPSCRPCNGKESYYTDKNGCGNCRPCTDSTTFSHHPF
ncbi:hypothetical protein HA402_005650 [Bradysia odoriphaga]|nr:hypothetical protein HA402_005650 [Bradysia odoriphaga]